jgi:PAS domain S-box-containing protein
VLPKEPEQLPGDESGRLESLARLELVGAAPEERFDRITRLTARLLDAPICVLALVDRSRVLLKSRYGINLTELERQGSLFDLTLLTRRPLVVDDATTDPRAAGAPLLTSMPSIRFFAGQSLTEPAGHRVGVLAVMDVRPRRLADGELAVLADAAALAERELGRSAFDRLLDDYRENAAWAMAVMDNAAEAIVTVDQNSVIRSINRSGEAMFGRRAFELVGRDVATILAVEDRRRIARAAVRALDRPGQRFRVNEEATGLRPDGATFPIEISVGGVRLDEDESLLVAVVRDLTERREQERQRAQQEARHVALFAQSPIAICLVAPDGRFLEANPALRAFIGRPESWFLGHDVDDVTHPDDRDRSRQSYAAVARREAPGFSMEKRYLTADGSVKWGSLTVAGVFKPDGKIDYFVAMIQDITQRKESEARLVEALEKQRQANEELDRISKAKSYFVSLVGHEFRTALTGIQGFSELLAEQDFGADEVKEFAGEIHKESLRLTRMISEMLDLDRMESGRMKLNYGRVDLNKVVIDVAERWQATTDEHRLVLKLAGGIGTIDGDADKLTQVVSNLVSNAIKYSPRGGTVTLATARQSGEAEVRVSDTGLGIPADAMDSIFERYARHDAKDRELIKGTGLGLPVVRQIVEMHSGRVWVESEIGKGSTFHVVIPVRRPRGGTQPEAVAAEGAG